MKLKNQNKFLSNRFENIIVLFFFIILTIVGYILHTDYGISLDEESTRLHGFVTLNYICEFFFPNEKFSFQTNNIIPKLNDYAFKEYGIFFEIFLALIIEVILEIKNFS